MCIKLIPRQFPEYSLHISSGLFLWLEKSCVADVGAQIGFFVPSGHVLWLLSLIVKRYHTVIRPISNDLKFPATSGSVS